MSDTALARIEHHEVPAGVAPNLFGSSDPHAAIEVVAEHADALKGVLTKQDLTVRISKRDYIKVEGWTLLGSLLGVFPVCAWSRPLGELDELDHHYGWEARVEAVTRSGEVVGAAEAMCTRSESTWRSREEYALRSMAQTRATSKALRQPLGFIVVLAGYDATPYEEIPRDGPDDDVEPQDVEPEAPATQGARTAAASGSTFDGAAPASAEQITRLVGLFGGTAAGGNKALRFARAVLGEGISSLQDLNADQAAALILRRAGGGTA